MLREGRVVNPNPEDEDTRVIRELNEQVCKDPRVDAVLLTVGDGLLLAKVR
jgi:predicted O-methyltransferase YrrM